MGQHIQNRGAVVTDRSPYPWISDKIWRAWERLYSRSGSEARRPIENALVTPVSPDDRRRAHVLPLESPATQESANSTSSLNDRLARTLIPGRVSGVRWPSCCDRLAVLVYHHGAGEEFDLLEARAGRLDDILLESHTEDEHRPLMQLLQEWAALLEQIRRRRHSGESVDMFQCSNCGRLYGAYSEP